MLRFSLLFMFIALNAYALPLPRQSRAQVRIPSTLTANYDFEGIVQMSDCSGSLVRFENSQDTDQAMILTNGHCIDGGPMDAGAVLMNQSVSRSFTLMNTQGDSAATLNADMLLYATMTKTDVALYRVTETYAQILSSYGVHALTLSSQHPTQGQSIDVISGYWQRGYSCSIETFVVGLTEQNWQWQDSMRYSRPGCEVIGGTSGSPILLAGTRTIVGVNNTINEDGQRCTLDNPCETDANGNVTYQQGYGYGQETYWFYSCMTTGQLDFTAAGCLLPH